MVLKKNSDNRKIDGREADTFWRITRVGFASLFIAILGAKIIIDIPFPLPVFSILIYLFGITFVSSHIETGKFFPVLMVFDLIVIGALMYFLSPFFANLHISPGWFATIFYAFRVGSIFELFKKKSYVILYLAVSSACIFSIFLLSYMGQYPQYNQGYTVDDFFKGDKLHLIISSLCTSLSLVFLTLYYINSWGLLGEKIGELRNVREKLNKVNLELEEARSILEIKISARTKELEELNKKLEEKVKERTEEIEKRMEELEKFQKMMIGRELKMMELKKEIKGLKKEKKK